MASFSPKDSPRSDGVKAATLNEYYNVLPHNREEQSLLAGISKERKLAASVKTSSRKSQEEDFFRHVHYVNDVIIPDNVCGSVGGDWELSRSMMVHAAAQGNYQWVKQLLKEGAEDIFPDKVGWFPLHYAAQYGHLAVIRLLLEAGRDVDTAKHNGPTALQAASGSGHEDIVKLLILHGADVNAPAVKDFGRTALQAASERGYEDIVKWLILHGADINAPAAEHDGQTALQRLKKAAMKM